MYRKDNNSVINLLMDNKNLLNFMRAHNRSCFHCDKHLAENICFIEVLFFHFMNFEVQRIFRGNLRI
jgi:hypothetical protein